MQTPIQQVWVGLESGSSNRRSLAQLGGLIPGCLRTTLGVMKHRAGAGKNSVRARCGDDPDACVSFSCLPVLTGTSTVRGLGWATQIFSLARQLHSCSTLRCAPGGLYNGPHYPASLALWLWIGRGPWEVAARRQGFSFLPSSLLGTHPLLFMTAI